ncbi:Fc.00g030720.m01.CDS01 [Cosmosporella sp. VM-42]
MIAIGGSVGTGLIIGSGQVLTMSAPGPLIISFLLVGINVYLVTTAVGEMASYLPQQSGFAGYAERFVDPALGFSLGMLHFHRLAGKEH